MDKKNIYIKLQEARVKLQNTDVKKSGKNTYSGYTYFELSDFLPHINVINQELGIYTEVSFTNELATLTIINADAPEEIRVFTSPMREASLKGCHDIQNLGAVESYQRRYLYMAAYEVVEADVLEATTGKEKTENKNQGSTSGTLTDGQIKRLYAIANSNSYTKEQVHKGAKKYYNVEDLKTLTKEQYQEFCDKLGAIRE